jgi:prepilin-type N-terminal cleavage/methylation domain-containing protein
MDLNQNLVTSAATFRQRAFSLIELLVVITIIGILAAIGLPALRGLGGSTGIDAAKNQLLNDLSLARQRAMNERTTVYVLFVPPGVTVSNLYNHQLTSYALFTRRSAGDQPGRGRERFRTEWKHLPENTFIPAYKFIPSLTNAPNEYDRAFPFTNLLYTTKSISRTIPFRYLAFNALGQLDTKRGDEMIPLTKGSIFYSPNGKFDPVETPSSNSMTNFFRYGNNFIRINWLTGRARIEKREPL